MDSTAERKRVLTRRRRLGAGLALLVLAAGFLLSLRLLNGLRREGRPDTSRTRTHQELASVLDFAPAPGWHVLVTDPSTASRVGVQAWATNVPFAEDEETPIGPVNSFPDGWPDKSERDLPAEGLLLVANYALDTRNPVPLSSQFPVRDLPLRIESPPSVQYEGQAKDRALAVVNATVNGRYLTVRIVFGTPDPGSALLREAEQELARLIVAGPPATTTELNDFGIRMNVPDPWHRIMFRWPVGEPAIHAATVPITDLYDGSSARRELGPQDLFVVLSEDYAAATHYRPETLPIAIGPEDLCPTCEIMDNGTSPPPEHTLYYRSFAVGRRQFNLFVEFGAAEVSEAQLAELNSMLASLQIDSTDATSWDATLPTAPPESPVPSAPIRVEVPPGWIHKKDPVPGPVAPRVVAAFGTWDFPGGGPCGPEPALAELPADGALVWIVEHANPGNRGDFIELLPIFSIDLQTPPARWECAAAAPSRMYLFRDAGRYFEFHVALGANATAATVAQAAGG
jgi:hypothetical protein